MKLPIQINGETIEITLTSEQIAQIEAQKKPKKFELKYPELFWFVASDGIYRHDTTKWFSPYAESGRYRKSQEAAEQTLARNKRANRLEALAEQLGSKSYPWGSAGVLCYVYQTNSCTYQTGYTDGTLQPEVVYMEEVVAYEICRMLNEGEFSLDGEL